jgi:arabinogalactan endo-1,4-beta-galactosidase
MRYFLVIVLFVSNYIVAQTSDFIKGADISFVPQIEYLGGAFTIGGTQTDPVEVFSQNGVDYIRLRLWHTPTDGYCGLAKTIQMATRIKQSGSKFLLDIHYSDTWADPAHQTKPVAWQSLTYTQLVDSIYSYTYSVVQALNTANVLPDMIQIGNEITVGFLWPEGRVGGSYNTTIQWQQFTTLLKTARNAIVDAVPGTTIPVMLHIDRGGDNAGSRWFFDKMNSYQVPYDYIGLSFYPWWHGTLTQLTQNLNDLATRYNKNIIVVETAYPWTLQAYDNVTNIVGSTSQLHDGYPSTVEGQFNFLFDLIQIVKNVPNNKGKGIFIGRQNLFLFNQLVRRGRI